MAEVITVSALNRYVKSLFDANDRLFDLALRGEVANFVQNARSGHCYFTLRDEQASVKAVMFRSDARRLAFRPEEGMRVVVRCLCLFRRVHLECKLGSLLSAQQLHIVKLLHGGHLAAVAALEKLGDAHPRAGARTAQGKPKRTGRFALAVAAVNMNKSLFHLTPPD